MHILCTKTLRYKIKFIYNAVDNTMKMLSGKCTSVYTLTGKAHWTTSCYIKTVEEIKKYSIIKITPEKSVAYFYIQLYNVSQKEKKKNCTAGSWGCELSLPQKRQKQKHSVTRS